MSVRTIVISLVVAFASLSAWAGNPGAGAKKAEVCAACHGNTGNVSIDDSTPKIGGQYQSYLLHALRSYKKGSRTNVIMAGQVANLTDEDLQDLAAYFALQPSEVEDLHGKL